MKWIARQRMIAKQKSGAVIVAANGYVVAICPANPGQFTQQQARQNAQTIVNAHNKAWRAERKAAKERKP